MKHPANAIRPAIAANGALRTWYLSLLYGGFVSTALGFALMSILGDDLPASTLIAPGAVAMVASGVCGSILLYRSWHCVSFYTPRFDSTRRPMHPADAVVLTLVPLVNIVGVFSSWGRLPGELNWLAGAAEVEGRVPEGLGTSAAAMAVAVLIPFLGVLSLLVGGLVLIPRFTVSCSKLAESIEHRLTAPGGS